MKPIILILHIQIIHLEYQTLVKEVVEKEEDIVADIKLVL